MSRKAISEETKEVLKMMSSWLRHADSTKSPCTVSAYEQALVHLMDYLDASHKVDSTKVTWNHFSHDTLEKWMLWMRDEKRCSPQTCNMRLSAVHSFLRYSARKDKRLESLFVDSLTIEQLRAVKPDVKGLSDNAVEAIFKSIDTGTIAGMRDYLACRVLLEVGLRISELTHIKIADLILSGNRPSVSVLGKGNKRRTLLLGRPLAKLLGEHIAITHDSDCDRNEYVFFSSIYGKSHPVTERMLQKRIKEIGDAARTLCPEVPENLHPHQFRHTYGTKRVEQKIPLAIIQKEMGHESPTTTTKYIDYTEKMKEDAQTALESEEEKNMKRAWKDDASFWDFLKSRESSTKSQSCKK